MATKSPRHGFLPAGHKFGWDAKDEDNEWLMDCASPAEEIDEFAGEIQTVADVTPLIRNQSQRSWPSCRGHSLSNCIEWLYMTQTGQPYLEMSRHYCWVETQRMYTRPSRSRGATMSHGLKMAMEKGVCAESYWPYPYPNYTSKAPRGAYENAKQYKIRRYWRVKRYEEIVQLLGSGVGVVDWGIKWKSSVRVKGRRVVESYGGSGGGGHATMLPAVSPRKDRHGDHYIWLTNSHGASYGYKGSVELSPSCVRAILSHGYTRAYGVSDLKTPRRRPLKFSEMI